MYNFMEQGSISVPAKIQIHFLYISHCLLKCCICYQSSPAQQSWTLIIIVSAGKGWTDISVCRYIWPIPIYRYRKTGYRYQPYQYRFWYRFLWISVISVSSKIHGYRPKYQHISAKIPGIGQISAKMKISVSVADMLVQINRYRQKYRLGTYIGIGWTHIGPTLQLGYSYGWVTVTRVNNAFIYRKSVSKIFSIQIVYNFCNWQFLHKVVLSWLPFYSYQLNLEFFRNGMILQILIA